MSGDHNMNQKKPMIKIDGVEINQTTPYIDYDAWMASPLTKALKDKLEAAVAAERERLLSTEIHSCHADCQRFACVQTRKAVEAAVAAERERIIEKNAPVIEQINAHMKEAVAAEREALIALLKGIDQTETESPDGWWETSTGADFGAGILAAIRARGENK